MTEAKIPVVSVIIPSYNHERYVGEAIESVLAQSVSDFEIVVVDDGSSDDSVNVVKKFHDNRIRLFSQNNKGAHQALNRGVSLASAPWTAILNSDDRFRSDKLEKHLALHVAHPEWEASACRVRYIAETGAGAKRDGYLATRYEKYKRVAKDHDSLFVSLLKVNHLITTSSLFMRRETLRAIGGFIPLKYVHDWFMFLTLARRGHFHVIEEELTDYRRHSGNTIVENDERGRIEDNFVIEWQIHEALKSGEPPLDLEEVLSVVTKNRRVNYRLILLFQLWRQLNRCDLKEASRIFGEKDNPVLNRAFDLLRRDRGIFDILTAVKRTLGHAWPSLADYVAQTEQLLGRFGKKRGT